MEENKKSIRQRLTRQQQVEKALEKTNKTPFVNRWGMTPEKINETFKNKSNRVTTKKVRKTESKKPQKAYRNKTPDRKIRLLLEAPAPSIQTAIQYPTPSWLTIQEKADVSVIVPIYKSAAVVKDLIKSWELYNDGLNVELIFVDDCCPMDSKTAIVQHWMGRKNEIKKPFVRIFYNSINQGFGVTCNTGAYYATGKYLIFLNSDTVVTKSWIRPMVRLLQQDDVGIVGNMQIKRGGQWNDCLDGAGSEWHWSDQTFHHIGRHSYRGKKISNPFNPKNCPKDVLDGVHEREMVTGCCLAIKKNLFDEIGGFNPNYRIGYWEDSELCLSVREKGYKILYTANSKIYHKLGHSGSGGHKFQDHNKNFFINKWVNTGRIDSLVNQQRPEPLEPIKNILIRRFTANGDVLVATAVASALKKKHPGCNVYFNTGHPNVLAGNPYVDGLIADQDIVERKFQIYYNLDMVYEQRPYTNILEAYADAVGVKSKDCKFFLKTTPVKKLPDNYIVFHAGKTNWVGRDWSDTKFNIVANRLISEGHNIICVGHGRDHKVSCHTDLRNVTDTYELAYVIRNAKLFVGIDSFPMHVAQVFETPGVCFFGSISPHTRIYRNNMTGITAEGLKCLGCHHRKPAPCTVTSICEIGAVDCVNRVSVDQMLQAIKVKLEAK